MALLNLRCSDRSRHETGLDHCPRDRYLQYHAGPHGYGWRRRAEAMPTLTGTLAHQPLTTVMASLIGGDGTLPDHELVYDAITAAQADYLRIVASRGLVGVDPADIERRANEQMTLLEGLTWAYVTTVLPAWLQTWQPLLVEAELGVVVDCTCGLGDRIGEPADHDARGCTGVNYQTRGDVVAEHRQTRTLSYTEFKTASQVNVNWEAQWTYKVQAVAGVLGAERRLERQIDEVYIPALIKGKFQSAWDSEAGKPAGPKFQDSVLVYGWRREGIAGLTDEQWAAQYNYTDEAGKRRRLGKDFRRTPVWELPAAQWNQGDCHSPSEYWTRWIGPELLAAQVKVLGPLRREEWKLQRYLRQLTGEERRWQETLWTLYELTEAGHGWGSAEFMDALDAHAPQATGQACHSYFGQPCPFVPVCERHPGWQDPKLMGFIERRPHHADELDQMIARGLLPPDEGAADDGGGDE